MPFCVYIRLSLPKAAQLGIHLLEQSVVLHLLEGSVKDTIERKKGTSPAPTEGLNRGPADP